MEIKFASKLKVTTATLLTFSIAVCFHDNVAAAATTTPSAAASLAADAVSVDLTSAGNVSAIFRDGTAPKNGGLDTYGYALSANLLGSSTSWTGVNFVQGVVGAASAVSSTSVALPSGSYTTLKLLALGANGNQPNQRFTITYTDGSTSSVTQSISDWWYPQNYGGETTVLNLSYCVTPVGGKCAGPTAVYGYSFAIDSTKKVKSLALPNNRNVVLLAAALIPATAPSMSSVDLGGSANVYASFKDGTVPIHGGLVGSGYAISANLTGSTIAWSNTKFTMGTAGTPNGVTSATVALPAGKFTALKLLAVGAHGNQVNQPFTVTYADGTQTTVQQSVSNWWSPANNPGETTVLNMGYCVTPSGAKCPVATALYGYSLSLNGAKTVKSLTLPNNRNVVLLGAALASSEPAVVVPSVLAFGAAEYNVTQSGNSALVSVSRTGAANVPVSVQYETSDGSGVAGSVYTAKSGTLQWAANDMTAKTINVPLSTSTPFAGEKTFSIALFNPSAGAELNTLSLATINVTGAAAMTTVQMSAPTYSVAANAGSLTVSVTRSNGATAPASVAYATASGTAVAGTNFSNVGGTLHWAANDSSAKTFSVPINNSKSMSGNANFKLQMSAPDGATLGPNSTATVTITPVSAPASAASSASKALSYLSGLNKGNSARVLSGQHADIWNSNGNSVTQPMDVVSPLRSQTGQDPAILALVLNYATESYAYSVDVTNTLANQWWAKGGMVMISLYSNDPTFSFNTSGAPLGKNIPSNAFHKLTDKSSAEYKQWHSQLDTYAAALHKLTDSGNVVLFRPFIELNGNWNWYGAQNTADFIAVWRDMKDYMMNTKGLKNVLWIYNVNAQVGNYTTYYPGDSEVDIVGMDIYATGDKIVAAANNGGMYQALVATGKPLIFPEIGLLTGSNPRNFTADNTAIINDIRTSLPNVVGFIAFNGGWSICNQNNASSLMNDPWVINASDLPNTF